MLAWRIVRLHGAATTEAARFGQGSDRLRRLSLKAVAAAAAMTPITQVLAACALSAVVVVALWQSSSGGASVGSFVAFVTAMLMLIAPIKHLSEIAGPVTRGLAALERGVALIEQSPAEVGGTHDPGRAQGRIGSSTSRCATATTSRRRSTDVDARAAAGRDGGAGRAVGRGQVDARQPAAALHRSDRRRLLLDGVPLPDWNVQALRRQFALVSQDVVLFNDTHRRQRRLGDELDRERVRPALRGANLLDFVAGLPQGMDTASATTAASCPAASASAWRSRAPSTRTRRS